MRKTIMHSINPVILSGGMGSRLWPMSRVLQPKQFQPVNGVDGQSFLQATALRHRGAPFNEPVVVANARQVGLIASQLDEVGVSPTILGEPVGRNTGPAVLAAALRLLRDDPDALLLVLPSDHVIDGDLNDVVGRMRRGAEEGRIVTFGITPRYPETGFGYITRGEGIPGCPGLHAVSAFVEKPDLERAQALVDGGNAHWASGISLMRADVIVEEFRRLEPETFAAVEAALEDGTDGEAGSWLMDEAAFSKALDEPTERAVFERTQSIAVAPVDVAWNDVGAWSAVHSIGRKCEGGNVLGQEVMAIETRNSLVRGCGKLIAVIGMEDVIVVDTPDALLVTNHGNAQMVKDAVKRLKNDGRQEVDRHAAVEAAREQGAEPEPGPGTAADRTRRLEVAPGRFAEVTGTGEAGSVVTVAAGIALLKVQGEPTEARAGQIFFVRPGETARIGNIGSEALTLVSVDIADPDAQDRRLAPAQVKSADQTEPGPAAARRHVA
ncbi:mannose-1-phosphate guanylyltransferase [Histidinibacterium lentulum]|uniref:Mannose-1-phosphate guanylyltransferase/mannose-6-phosphate isomerase n=1 Tax=Histidinibacterium lentulum TaxID=2480588 RepID=A0A3N2R819_9RHOB|nr:sugar phosphate nucleotidyltransferase [Histidinibacterium lentulum]ROU03619.1 mannose-1-phosphate guanylyltransferase/mannose-6-phosphate isomerase [Histidinibacterium lentulum]